ncbi:MAG TPA: sugar phosphate nucleotidyltransferase [Candidatus Eisenbacteria bacterium]|nr:sugar phosphate nucleotidyltransferase [Candidatus Eisenbacteria bacterium]
MKGIILAGGNATRLRPLTKITSKQLLPVYNKPMIFYPIETLASAGITEILIIIAPDYAGHFLYLLGSGKEYGLRFTYEIQEEPRGLADAFIVGEEFMKGDSVTMILGDNIFEDNFEDPIKNFKKGGHIFAKQVSDPEKSAVVEFNENGKVVSIVEKPKEPKSNYAVPGIYIFDHRAPSFAKSLKPSARGELEIVDMYMNYFNRGELEVTKINGWWEDAGTFDGLLRVNNFIADRVKKGEIK